MDGNLSRQEEVRNRTKRFALRIIRLFQHLPRTTEAQVLGKQLLRSGTSVGANYRAAGRARSKAEFISLSLKRRTKQFSGLNASSNRELLSPNCLPISSPRRMSWWPFLLPPKGRRGDDRAIGMIEGQGPLTLDDPMIRSPDLHKSQFFTTCRLARVLDDKENGSHTCSR
jgi:hypothetical protein